jgi:hypothetical protein
MSEELKPETAEVEVLPETVIASEAAREEELVKSGRRKKLSERTPEEKTAVRKYNQAKTAAARARSLARHKLVDADFDSKEEVNKKEAKRILQEGRGIRSPRILEICVELAEVASRNLKLPFNASLFQRGLQGTLAAARGEAPQAFPPNEWHPGERVRENELYAAWDYACSWRVQPDGTKLSFEDWKVYRRRCITDVVWFGNTVLGKSFEQEPHGRWAKELFPQLEPALLSLPEKFGQKDIAKAFHALSDVRQRCLISARSSFKSTFSTVFTLALMLCFAGSVRILVCTATQPLAKGFAKAFRSLLTVRDVNNPSLLNQLWPEHSISPDDGRSLEYLSPFRQLDALIEPTLTATSVISEGQAGARFDLCVMDDVAEISNSNTPEMRAKTQERVDLLLELGEPHSLVNFIGTPTSPGEGTKEDPGDVYSVLLRREEKNQKEGNEPKLLPMICPAWTVNLGISKKAWDPTLTEDEVTLLFPGRLTFRYLMGKLKANLATDKSAKIFRQQSLVSWVPDNETEIKMTFSEADLRSHLRPRSFYEDTAIGLPVYLALDRAWSKNATADFSAISVVRVQTVQGKPAMVVLNVLFDRWKESELIEHVCKAIEQYQPSAWVLEKDRGHEELVLGVKKMCYLRSLPMPYVLLREVRNEPMAKAMKIKILEAPLVDNRLWFATGSWNDAAFQQFIRFTGPKRSGSSDGSKDDIPDSIATAYQVYGPRSTAELEMTDPKEKERRQIEIDQEAQDAHRREMYQAMFAGPAYTPPTADEAPAPAKPMDPRMVVFGNKGPWRL